MGIQFQFLFGLIPLVTQLTIILALEEQLYNKKLYIINNAQKCLLYSVLVSCMQNQT